MVNPVCELANDSASDLVIGLEKTARRAFGSVHVESVHSGNVEQPGFKNSHEILSGASSESSFDAAIQEDLDVDLEEKLDEDVRNQLRQPPKFAVVLLNDDYTTMEFVVEVLRRFFHKTGEEAVQVMLRVHQEGRGVAGIYSHDIAETKVFQVHQLAKSRGYPLQCLIEPVR